MDTLDLWIRDGALSKRPTRADGSALSTKFLVDTLGLVRVWSDDKGTHAQWNMGCANWASLLFLSHFVMACPGPFHLKYFNMGWFEEQLPDAVDAQRRIEELLTKSDVRLVERAFTRVAQPSRNATPDTLREALETGYAPDNRTIVCHVDAERHTAHVEHVGDKSLIAQIWGINPNSYPLMTGHSYDRTVTPQYFNVASTGRPHYDHVLAAMMRPDGETQWMAYHRVILPDGVINRATKRVRIVSEFAPVGIQLL